MEQKKYQIVVCTGTLCHVLGGSELPSIVNHIPKEWQNIVEIKGTPCIDYCHDKTKQPPFAEVNGTLIQEATIQKIINYLKTCIENDAK